MALRIAIVGLGARGRQWVDEVDSHPGWLLASGVEPRDETRATAGTVMGGRPMHASLTAALVDSPDAAIVVTPAETHVAVATEILKAGVPVMVEKPLATSLADAQDIVRRAQTAGLPLLVGQNYRYMRSHRTVRKCVSKGMLGEVLLTSTQYYRGRHDMPRSLAQARHRIMWGMGVHHLDALRWSLDRDITGVFARSFTVGDPSSTPGASLHVLLEFDGGARGVYTATYESSGHEFFEKGQEFYERIVGTNATLHMFQRWLFVMPRGRWPRLVRRGKRGGTEERFLLDQFQRSIRTGEPADCSGEENLKTMAVVEACLRSAAENRWIDVKELLDV